MTYHKTKCIFPDTPNCNINTLNPMRMVYRSNEYVNALGNALGNTLGNTLDCATL